MSEGHGQIGSVAIRALERLQYHSDTFSRLPQVGVAAAADLTVPIIRSVLNCRCSVIVCNESGRTSDPDDSAPAQNSDAFQHWEILAIDGAECPPIPLSSALCRTFDQLARETHVAGVAREACENALTTGFGVKGAWLCASLRHTVGHREMVFALCLAADRRQGEFGDLDYAVADILASVLAGALIIARTNRDLVVARVASEQAAHAKSEFLANMSHEIRTPLHGILSFARFGKDKALTAPPEKLLDYFQKIDASGNRLMVLLSDILDLARLESGRMNFDFAVVDFRTVVRSVHSEFQSLCAERDLKIEYAEPEGEIRLTLDDSRMGQVIRNLISNAAKFAPPGGTIWVTLQAGDREVRLSIRDNGDGIPDGELESVFDKFVQSSKTRSGAGGTGLGLSICREIIDAHKGRIWAENHRDGGAVFHVVLPVGLDASSLDAPVCEGTPERRTPAGIAS